MEKGLASATINSQLTAIKAFTKWLDENQKLSRDPLKSIRKPSPNKKRSFYRRILLPDEWKHLKATVSNSPPRYNMEGEFRILLYELAIKTGLRTEEIRSLRIVHLFLDEPRPFVICEGKIY